MRITVHVINWCRNIGLWHRSSGGWIRGW
jgi:hypothetical protein